MGQWFKIRSWHIVRTFTRAPGGAKALCGKYGVQATFLPEPEWSEKTCESCLRIKERDPAIP